MKVRSKTFKELGYLALGSLHKSMIEMHGLKRKYYLQWLQRRRVMNTEYRMEGEIEHIPEFIIS